MATMHRDYTVAIVGGGIGGLCCAVGLRHQGINVEIYEGTVHHLTSSSFISDHALTVAQPRLRSQR